MECVCLRVCSYIYLCVARVSVHVCVRACVQTGMRGVAIMIAMTAAGAVG